MDPVVNPYRPGAGRRPLLLAGREPLLQAFDVVRRRAEEHGEGDRSWALTGLRGVGKTALLGELLSRVSGRGWVTAKVEVTRTTPLPQALSQALLRAMRTATGRHPERRLRRLLGVFKAFSMQVDPGTGLVSLGVDVEPVAGVADSGRFAADLVALFEVLGETSRELGVGTLVQVDELQEARAEDLLALNTAVHALGQAEVPLPLVVIGAGLPSLPAQLADATSYAERLWEFRTLGLLEATAARAALVGPARERGVSWRRDALAEAVTAAGGSPYVLQVVGKHVWDVARRSPISLDDVAVGLAFARREVDDGWYRSRWDRATPAQQAMLRAVASLGGGHSVGVADLVPALGKRRASDLSVARGELIRKGLLYVPERGALAFTVPGMHAFVARQD